MKIDFDRKILDLDGDEIPLDRENDKTPVTLKIAALRALTSPLDEDRAIPAEESFKRYELARSINKGGEIEITPEQAVLIRNRAPKVWVLEISGVVYEMLKG